MSSYNVNGVILSPAVSGAVVTPSQYNNKVLALQQILDLASQLNANIGQCTSQFNAMQEKINSLTTVVTGQYITADLVNALIDAINSVYDYEECLVSFYNSQGIYPNVPFISTVSPVQKGQIITAYSWNNWNQAIYDEFIALTLMPFLIAGSESIGFVSPSPSITGAVSPQADTIGFISPSPSVKGIISTQTDNVNFVSPSPAIEGTVSPQADTVNFVSPSPSISKTTQASPSVFAGYSTTPGYVDKIDPSTMTLVKTFTAPSKHIYVHALTSLSGYVFAGYDTSPGYVDKIDASTMSLIKTFTAPSGHIYVYALTSMA